MGPDHDVPACEHCQADAFPSSSRQGEGHVAIRFGDYNRSLRVFLGGELVTVAILEAIAGADGWVIVAAGTCPRRGHGLWQRRHGDVHIRRDGI